MSDAQTPGVDPKRLDIDNVYRRLPALTMIDDMDIRNETARLSARAPPYFWEVPASTSEYHHPACREPHGLWAHTLMVVTALARLEASYREQDRLGDTDRDHALAAAILHDQRKRGPAGTSQTSAARDHDLQMARVIERESDLPQPVADAVATHMGPWYAGPTPHTDLQDLVHTADMVASTATVTPGLPAPIPDELDGLDVPEVEL